LTLVVGIVAGEPSGDLLGAHLMAALRSACSEPVRFVGVGGAHMMALGLQSIADADVFAVNGFVEPLKRLPRLWQTFRRLRDHYIAQRPAVFVGIDFNVFNLILERALKRRGVRTVHYVSPSVYAWRRGRAARIGRAADLVLTLFPFEPALYAAHGVRAEFVGHPLADQIEPGDHRPPARAALGLTDAGTVIALLPGSRRSELELHARLFFDVASEVGNGSAEVVFVVPAVDERQAALLSEIAGAYAKVIDVRVTVGNSRDVLAAADVALIKSGTGALEALLLGTPMVVTYRLPALSYRVVKMLLRTPYVALPNILAGRALVPELLQDAATPVALAAALCGELESVRNGTSPRESFRQIHLDLRRGASDRAARAVLGLVGR
jgi:lipid-A-disaccharide synthase